MDLTPTADQQEVVALFAEVYADHCTPESVQAAETADPGGHDARLWRRLVEAGAVEMAVGEECASLLDLALVAEQHGRFVAPTPMIEAQVAARLLERAPGATDLLDPARIAAGEVTVTLAVRPVTGSRAELVPAGAVADHAIVLSGDRLLLTPLAGRAVAVGNLAAAALADVEIAPDAPVLAEGREAARLFATAVDEWRVLTAAALFGVAQRALEIGVAYVKERKAFGQPVGQFQSVAHRLANRATEVDGAELLVRKAAWAEQLEPDRFAELAAMSLAFAAETAIATTHDALHFHGGYGFMVEYPVQLYYRRARAWGAVLESPAAGYRRAAAPYLSNDREGAA